MTVLVLMCASAATAAPNDPWEPVNRKVNSFNDFADRIFVKPIARGYRFITPDPVEGAVHRFFINLQSPVVIINQALQGKLRLAGEDSARFLLNSTVGVVGLFDVAAPMGLAAHDEDFGQTLSVWGVGRGPYLVLPFLGPSTPVDAVGRVVDSFAQPFPYIDDQTVSYSLVGLQFVDVRAQLLASESLISGDRYTFLRDAYLQRRQYLINDGEVADPFLDEEF